MIYLLLLTGLLTGCRAHTQEFVLSGDKIALLDRAREALAAGEFQQARQITRKVLEEEPKNSQAEKLMAEIIDQEIARHKEMFLTKTKEEFTPEEKADEIKTWLERAQALAELHQYDEALLAAEKVFLYDPENLKASRLIDQIKKRAFDEGQGESLIMKQMYQEEIQERVEIYRKQARQWMDSGQWGAARLAVEKMLLLAPEDKEALKLHEEIKEYRKLQSK